MYRPLRNLCVSLALGILAAVGTKALYKPPCEVIPGLLKEQPAHCYADVQEPCLITALGVVTGSLTFMYLDSEIRRKRHGQ